MKSILCVEDSPVQAELLRTLLVEHQYDVTVAPDGTSALSLLNTLHFDLVVTDVVMPGISGYQLCRQIKSLPGKESLPVILLTSLNGPADILEGIECGADNYVTKPFRSETLLGRIEYQLAHRVRATEGKLKVGVEFTFLGRTFTVTSEREQIIDLLISTCEDIVRANQELRASRAEVQEAKARVEQYARRMEVLARASEGKYRRLMDQANDAIVLVNTQGTILEVNRRGETLLGRQSTSIIGRSWEDLWPDSESDTARAHFNTLLAEGHFRRDIVQVRRTDGQKVYADYSASVIELEGEHVVLVIIHDATERQRLEDQLRQAQKMEAVGRLAGGVAHDFNNLIQVITGYGDVALSTLPRDHVAWDMIEQMKRAGERAADLTRQLLAFSRRQIVVARVLDLNAVIANVEKLLRRVIGEDIELVTSLEPSLASVRADAGQLEQVLVNLAVNARDAMPKGGKLTIGTANVELDSEYARLHPEARAGSFVLLAVSDNGCGMDQATRARVFEPFFTTKETGKGTGLGLATVYGIIKQAGGHVSVYSEPGHGATFKVYLPVQDQPQRLESPNIIANTVQRGSETILFVEDDDTVRQMTAMMLRKHGYQVFAVSNGNDGVRICRQYEGTIHLLLTDVVMPLMQGPEVARRVAELRPDARVIFVSGYTDDAVVRHGILSSQMDFLQKPFTVAGLTRKVREVLDREPRTGVGSNGAPSDDGNILADIGVMVG